MGNLKIYVSGGRVIECWCSRYQIDGYSLIIETYLPKQKRDLLRNNIRPGAVSEFYRLLGKPYYYDTSFGCNTITVVPVSGSNLYQYYTPKTIYVKNYTERITPANDFHVKIVGYISGSLV